MLSARTKDESTLKAAKALFGRASTPAQIARMEVGELERIIKSVGFYRAKARNLQALCRRLVSVHGGKVPSALEGLISLPGVGRKTANIVLGQVFGKDAIAVDVHVHRISNRLGWAKTKKPGETETALMGKIPKKMWKVCNVAMVAFGQTVCTPRNPMCAECPIKECCKRVGIPVRKRFPAG
ncbi:MAG: endonuclease III, partial [Candidatus Bilamarchaeaceae archaeon]